MLYSREQILLPSQKSNISPGLDLNVLDTFLFYKKILQRIFTQKGKFHFSAPPPPSGTVGQIFFVGGQGLPSFDKCSLHRVIQVKV